MVDTLARRINENLLALSDQSVVTLRKERRRWSATLRHHSAEAVFAVALELVESFNHRWIAYELLLFHPSALKLVGPHNVERFAGGCARGERWTSLGFCSPDQPGAQARSTTARFTNGRYARTAGGDGPHSSRPCR